METIYGIHSVLELLGSDPGRIERLWIAGDTENPRLRRLAADARRRGVPVSEEPRAALQRRCGSGGHQGVVAAVTDVRVLDAVAAVDAAGPDPLLLVVDGVTDPQNLGAILRTAEAAAVSAVFLAKRHTAPLSSVTVKASAGAVHHLRLARIGNTVYFIEELQRRQIRVVGLHPGEGIVWCDADLKRPLALVLGAEGEGLRRLVRERCDQLVQLPMLGKVGSLNVAAAAAAILFECVRQRMR